MIPLKLEGIKKRKPQISLRLCGSLLNSYKKEETFEQNLKMLVLDDNKLIFAQFLYDIVLNT